MCWKTPELQITKYTFVGFKCNILYYKGINTTRMWHWCQAVCRGASTQLLWGPFSGPNATFTLFQNTMTWTEAQSACRKDDTDLASVRNLVENQRLENSAGRGYWIGLYRDSWKWSDGSFSSFRYWAENEPNHRVCVAAAFHDSEKWEGLYCGLKKPFICYGRE